MRYRMFVMCCAFSCAFSLSAAYGQEDAPDLAFDSAVAAIGQDATAKGALEEECLSTLKSSDEWADLYRAVRILSVIGTEKSVPVLSEMLVKLEQSHLARIALELIPGEEASAALRDALTKAPEKEAIGIASSLGVRKDSGAVSVLADLAAGDQEGLAQAALAALGHISGKKATEVLKSHILDQNRERAAVAAEALLVALEEAESDTETTAGVYESLLEKSWPDRIRAGAFMRILEEDTEKAVSHILEMVYSNDLFLRSVALASAISLKSGDLVGQLVEELPSLAEDVQARLIESLGKREEGIAEKTLHQFLHSPSEAVRIEAAKALGNNGTSASIAPLAEMIARAEGRTEKNVAAETLRRLKGKDVDAALVDYLSNAPLAARPEIIEVLAQRDVKEAVITLIAHTRIDGCAPAAFQALAKLADVDQVPVLLGLLTVLDGDKGRPEAENAAVALCRKAQEKDAGIEIRSAVYGDWPDGAYADVTDKVKQAVQDGTFSIIAQNADYGDPAPNIVKKLHLEYLERGVVKQKTVSEGATMNLASDMLPLQVFEMIKGNLLATTDANAQLSFLKVLSRLGDPTTFSLVQEYLEHSDPRVVDGAVRAVAAWPTVQALDTLVDLTQGSGEAAQQSIAFRGAVRLLRLGEISQEKTLECYKSLITAAKNTAERKLLLSGLGETGNIEAISLITALAKTEDLQAEADAALGRIKEKVGEEAFNKAMNPGGAAPLITGKFVSIFDGKTLDGWSGNPQYCRVEDGCIVLETKNADELEHNTFLSWNVEELEDFEIMFQYRIDSEWANSGIQIRSEYFSDEQFRVRGYQADISNEDWVTGLCYEEGGRQFLAYRGEKSVVTDDGVQSERFADQKALGDYIYPHDWNQYHVIVKGDTFVSRINGHTMHEVTDHSSVAKRRGIIAFQIHKGPPMKVLFKDVKVKKLEPASN